MALIWYTSGVFEPYADQVVPPTAAERAHRALPAGKEDQFTRVQNIYGQTQRSPKERRAVPLSRIMSRPVHVLPPEAPLESAAALMQEKGIRQVPIVNGPAMFGMVTDHDLLRSISGGSSAPGGRVQRVAEIMSRKVLTAAPDTDVREAVSVMLEHDIHALPVLAARQTLVGIVTTSDVLRVLAAEASLDVWI